MLLILATILFIVCLLALYVPPVTYAHNQFRGTRYRYRNRLPIALNLLYSRYGKAIFLPRNKKGYPVIRHFIGFRETHLLKLQ